VPDNRHVDSPRDSRILSYAWLGLLLVALHLVIGHRIRLAEWTVKPQTNAALEEAVQWTRGRLALETNEYEVARDGGQRYNVVGLAFTLLSVIGLSLSGIGGAAEGTFHPPYYVLLVFAPLPIAAFYSFRRVVGDPRWGALLAGYLLAATGLLPILTVCGAAHGGSIYFINHVLAVTGLLIFAADLLGPRRYWPAVCGLLLAAWSRQMTALYVLPWLWIAWSDDRSTARARPRVGRALRICLVGTAVLAAVPMALNAAKFGSPLDTGYARLYEGRTDPIGARGGGALFSPRYAPSNARAMNTALPVPDLRRGELYIDAAGVNGASIWLTNPLLLGVAITLPRWWRDPARRALMLGTLPVIAGLLLYHTSGSNDAGYYRYALDFVPVWLAVIAPHLVTRRALPWTLAATAWSAVYFSALPG
jgi:hypothetical protein